MTVCVELEEQPDPEIPPSQGSIDLGATLLVFVMEWD